MTSSVIDESYLLRDDAAEIRAAIAVMHRRCVRSRLLRRVLRALESVAARLERNAEELTATWQ